MAPRPGINLGDGANTAKYKMGLRQAEYHSAWRKLNVRAAIRNSGNPHH